MTNHDYNPPDHPLHFGNDPKQVKYTLLLAGIAAILIVVLLIAMLR